MGTNCCGDVGIVVFHLVKGILYVQVLKDSSVIQ